MTLPKIYQTRDGQKAILLFEKGDYYFGCLENDPSGKINEKWGRYTLNHATNKDLDLMSAIKEKETY